MGKKLHLRTSIISFLKLIRVSNLVILALTQYMVAIFLIGPSEHWLQIISDVKFFCLVFSTATIAAAGYIINDYYDIKIDIINKPKRVIVGRLLRRRVAITSHTVLNFLGIFIALFAGWKISTITFASAFLLWLYSNSLKRLPLIGNIIISILTGLSTMLVAIYFNQNIYVVFTYSTFAFFISLIREIIKDMEDVKGDAAFGCKTLPILVGIRKTKVFLYILMAVFTLSLLLLANKINTNIVLYFLIAILPSLLYLSFKLKGSDNSKDFHFLSKLCKFIMVEGVLSMLFI